MLAGVRSTLLRPFLFLGLILFSLESSAKDLCALYANQTPLPTWYNDVCLRTGGGGIRSVMGGAFSSFADSFNLNSASLPTLSLPAGAEMIASFPSSSDQKSRVNVSLIKGIQGLGFGASTDSNNSIYSNRVDNGPSASNNYSPIATPTPTGQTSLTEIPTINFGTAISLERLLFSAKDQYLPQVGLMMRYNNDLKYWSPGFGFSYTIGPVNLGVSYLKEKYKSYWGDVYEKTVMTETLGLQVWKVHAEYVYIANMDQTDYNSVSLYSVSANLLGVLFTAASRNIKSYASSSQIVHYGAQIPLSPLLTIGYMYNYIPGYQSLTLQILL